MFKTANTTASLYLSVRPLNFVSSRSRPWEQCICRYKYKKRN